MKVWVIDTNVVVSGLLSAHGHPAHLLDAVKTGAVQIAYDARILAEYREVLQRPHLRLASHSIADFLSKLRAGHFVSAKHRLSAGPDPDDLMFIEVALETTDKTIVTGNLRDYPPEHCHGVRVLTPAQAVAEL